MGRDLAEAYPPARKIYDRADAVLGFPLSRLCFEGPPEKLNATDIQQAAIFVTSAAVLAAMRSSERFSDIRPAYAAGLSLGEYTAYYAAEALDFESALKLVRARGRFMQAAAEASNGAMVVVISLDDETAEAICVKAREGDVLVAANFNCPGQVVLSGDQAACERAAVLAEQAGAMKAVMLGVAGGFHSPLMAPAAEPLRAVLNQTTFAPPQIPVIANVDGQFHHDVDSIRASLVAQVASATYWSKSMQKLLDLGVDLFVEIGPKRTLTGFMRRISRRTRTMNLSMASDLA